MQNLLPAKHNSVICEIFRFIQLQNIYVIFFLLLLVFYQRKINLIDYFYSKFL